MEYPKYLCDCRVCPVSQVAEKPVSGNGGLHADIMFIGQNPGSEEVKQRIPFCGPSGYWLDRIVKAIGYDRSEVYVTNVVKCLTPGNRLPTMDEMQKCAYWLVREVKTIQPKIVVPLGACALQTVMIDDVDMRITDMHGRRWRTPADLFKDAIIYPLYHPATLVYNLARNYPIFCNDIAGLIELLIEEGMVEPIRGDWKENFRF